jgi:hypothetical protein
MNRPFRPSFRNLDSDVERYLVSEGKCRKLKDGMVKFHGYYDAQDLLLWREQKKGRKCSPAHRMPCAWRETGKEAHMRRVK